MLLIFPEIDDEGHILEGEHRFQMWKFNNETIAVELPDPIADEEAQQPFPVLCVDVGEVDPHSGVTTGVVLVGNLPAGEKVLAVANGHFQIDRKRDRKQIAGGQVHATYG